MKGAIVVLSFGAAVATALLAFQDRIRSHRPATILERAPVQAEQTRLPSLTHTTDEPVSQLSGGAEPRTLAQPRSDAFVPAQGDSPNVGLPDNSSRALEWAKEEATRDVQSQYAVLLEHLGLSVEEQDALVALLVEEQFARATVAAHGQIIQEGKAANEENRSNSIATIIGGLKLLEFLALERNLPAYSEVSRIASLLKRNGAPITSAQRDKLLEILIETRGQHLTMPTRALTGSESSSLEYLDQMLTQLNEYERHVMELTPAVLAPQQVVYLDQHYQYQSYQRADAREMQSKQRAAGTVPESNPWWFPTWSD